MELKHGLFIFEDDSSNLVSIMQGLAKRLLSSQADIDLMNNCVNTDQDAFILNDKVRTLPLRIYIARSVKQGLDLLDRIPANESVDFAWLDWKEDNDSSDLQGLKIALRLAFRSNNCIMVFMSVFAAQIKEMAGSDIYFIVEQLRQLPGFISLSDVKDEQKYQILDQVEFISASLRVAERVFNTLCFGERDKLRRLIRDLGLTGGVKSESNVTIYEALQAMSLTAANDRSWTPLSLFPFLIGRLLVAYGDMKFDDYVPDTVKLLTAVTERRPALAEICFRLNKMLHLPADMGDTNNAMKSVIASVKNLRIEMTTVYKLDSSDTFVKWLELELIPKLNSKNLETYKHKLRWEIKELESTLRALKPAPSVIITTNAEDKMFIFKDEATQALKSLCQALKGCKLLIKVSSFDDGYEIVISAKGKGKRRRFNLRDMRISLQEKMRPRGNAMAAAKVLARYYDIQIECGESKMPLAALDILSEVPAASSNHATFRLRWLSPRGDVNDA